MLPLLAVAVLACHEKPLYKREFSTEEKAALSKQLLAGGGRYYYQGSVPEQFLIDEALALDPKHAAAWREKGVPYLKRGLAKEMAAYYDKAIALDKEWVGWHAYNLLYFYRDYEGAIALFNATDTITPGFTDYPQGQSVDYMRGLCYYGLGNYETALNYFSRYVEEVKQRLDESWVDPYAFLYRALTHEKLGNTEVALSDLDKALAGYPSMADGFYHKGRIHLGLGNRPEAQRQLAQAKESFRRGLYHQRPYVEVQEQLFMEDIEALERKLSGVLVLNMTK